MVNVYPITGKVWYRESTDEWVLELEGSINDTHFISRHTEPGNTAPEDVPSLPSLYKNVEAEAKLAKAVEALRALRHAVCGETGFAACVRLDSGKAYPWPALDDADETAIATLAEIKGGNDAESNL